MFDWLKKRLRNWLLDDNKTSLLLDCVIKANGTFQPITFQIVGVRGLCLLGEFGDGVRLIKVDEAQDTRHFWRLWNTFHGGELTWEEDGRI